MKGQKRRTLAAVLLSLSLGMTGAGAVYADLPETHWAYEEMSRAAQMGVVQGVGEGYLAPADVLTWGQFLTMLCRSFAPEAYAQAVAGGQNWDQAGYSAAMTAGLLRLEDRNRVDGENLGASVTRGDAALLLARALPDGGTPSDQAAALADFRSLSTACQTAVARLYDAGVVRGKPDGTFGGGDLLRRADGSVLVLRVLDQADPGPAVPALGPGPVETPQPSALQPAATPAPTEDYVPLGQRDSRLVALDENSQKYLLLFGDTEKYRFTTQAEAQTGMEKITVPVWKSGNGGKTAATLTLEVHSAMAREVEAIFTEIYHDPEQFPIYNAVGFRWQEGGKGEHNCGTAIDLNWEENYQVKDGAVMAGKLWQPGVNPYSIGPDSSVVRIFEAHGWCWGGDAWAADSDPAEGYHDYMHFSYLGG